MRTRTRVLVGIVALVLALGPTTSALAFTPDFYDLEDNAYTGAYVATNDFAPLASVPGQLGRNMAYGTSSAPIQCDTDFFELYVSSQDIQDGMTYMIEIDATESEFLPVVEIYGPEGAAIISSTGNPAALGDGWTDDMDSVNTGCFKAAIGSKWHDDGFHTVIAFYPDGIAEAVGTYFFRVRPYAESNSYWDAEGPYTVQLKKGCFTRIWGANRIATAVKFSQEQYVAGVKSNPGSEFGTRVVVATGYGFADALSGSALAGAVSSPLLLTNPNSLSPETAAELTRLAARDILVLGGPSAVSDVVVGQLNALVPGTVTRISGVDRVQTAVDVAEYIHDEVGTSVAFVADKGNFPDALSAAPLASLNNSPILLTDSDVADPRMLAALSAYDIESVIVMGGDAAISAGVEADIEAVVGAGHVRRIEGINRYETSKNFAAWACGLQDHTGNWADIGNDPIYIGTAAHPSAIQPLEPHGIGVASGVNYPDALAGGVFAGHAFAPILLTQPDDMSRWIFDKDLTLAFGTDFRSDVIDVTNYGLERSYLFGGTSAVSDEVFWDLDHATGNLYLDY